MLFALGTAGLTPRREPGLEPAAPKTAPPTPASQKEKAAPKPEAEAPKEEGSGKVEVKKENGAFGLSLVGGSDTPLVKYHTSNNASYIAHRGVQMGGFRRRKYT